MFSFFSKYSTSKDDILSEFEYKIIIFLCAVSIVPLIIFSAYFLEEGHVNFAMFKLGCAMVFLFLFLCRNFIDKEFFKFIALCSVFVYSSFAYLNPAESQVGFVWTFVGIFTAVFLARSFFGLFLFVFYALVILLIGLYDLNVTHYQFDNGLKFSIFYCAFVFVLFLSLVIQKSLDNLYSLLVKVSMIDSLSGLYNRRKIDEVLSHADADRKIAIGIADIDWFKKINDNFGHQTGDMVLKEFSNILYTSVRKTDLVGRWGGEEFIIIFFDLDLENALKCLQKIQAKINDYNFCEVGRVSASFGLAMKEDENIDKTISKADQALYEAKHNGRNCITVAK